MRKNDHLLKIFILLSCGLILFVIIILINWMLLLRERKRKRLAQLKILKTAARKFPDVWKSQGKVTYQMISKLYSKPH